MCRPDLRRGTQSIGSSARRAIRPNRLELQARGIGSRLRCKKLTVIQRVAVGGIGVSTIAAAALVLLAVNSGPQLSAMERMAKELHQITSYSYRESWESTWLEADGKRSITSKGDGMTCWMAPDAFRTEMKIVRIELAIPNGKLSERLLEHFAEIYPAGKPGIFVDFIRKTFDRLLFDPVGSRTYPADLVRMIQEGSGTVTRELGTKEIQGKKARGYVIVLKGSHEKRANDQLKDPVQVWVDPATDLPLEIGYEGKNESTYTHRVTDFRWNTALDRQLFEPTPPAGYADITPPGGDQELAQIAEALKLYAELSGGHYPQATPFDAVAVREEMLNLAGFTGTPKPAWNQDKKFLQIQQAARGLDWIARILRNRHHASYDGPGVSPRDKGKLLLWWRLWSPARYRVFYGDLRTEILSEAEGTKRGLAESFPDPPADDQKPSDNR